MALCLLVAHAIGGGKWWKVEPERQTPHSDAIGAAVSVLPTHVAFNALRDEVASALGFDEAAAALVANDASGTRTAVFAKLLEMPDKGVNRLLAVVMAETLASGTALIERIALVAQLEAVLQQPATPSQFTLFAEPDTSKSKSKRKRGKR